MKYLIEIASCVVGALGYALVYNVKRDKILPATIGGFITITVYVVTNRIFNQIILPTTLASAAITIYSEVLARKLKSPATVFLLPGIIPLVPGGGLFYTMSGLITGDKWEFSYYGMSTFQTAVGIAIGVILTSVIVYHINKALYKKIKKIKNTSN